MPKPKKINPVEMLPKRMQPKRFLTPEGARPLKEHEKDEKEMQVGMKYARS